MPSISCVHAISRLNGLRSTRSIGDDVGVLDMAPVLAQVRSDAVGAGVLAQSRGRHRIGLVGLARLTERGDVIDVNAQAKEHDFEIYIALVTACWLSRVRLGSLHTPHRSRE